MASIKIPNSIIFLGSDIKNNSVTDSSYIKLKVSKIRKVKSSGSGVRNYSNSTRRIVQGPIQNITSTINTVQGPISHYFTLNNWVGQQVFYKDSSKEYIWGLLKSVNVDAEGKLVESEVPGLNIEIEEINEPEPGII